ncbi:hypothetical protein BN946_scf184842.g14 [Trametes cinnabarina]|uniref:Phosphoglycerate mutase n=1 Tax=Pycnoporus cinnabarinus TaxID=5643 RepID=A0A060S264_PYCCI|nr:hypothetical protein BN946_scf184842.g14 [Trametes cinnabarina]
MGEYSIVTGFFAQDDPDADGVAIGALPDRFGLLDDSPQRWQKFKQRIDELNATAPENTQYKVFFFVRHGQGYHNVAEAKYGTEDWDEHWSKLTDDGKILWGPDPDLTSVGVAQAQAVRKLWEAERKHGLPLPERHYASPMRRALRTWHEIFVNDGLLAEHKSRVMILEVSYMIDTGLKTRDFPPPIYEFEDGFSEEDILWRPDERESKAHVQERAQAVMDRIFSSDKDSYICITAHSGIINGFIAAMGRPRYPLPTGGKWLPYSKGRNNDDVDHSPIGILPVVIKGVAIDPDGMPPEARR